MANESVQPHHIRQELCTNRPAYRDGRQLKAVKVYTVSQESRYLLVQHIPAVGALQELIQLFALYGTIEEYRMLDEYPTDEQFTDVVWIRYQRIQSSRIAKRKLDNYNFYGGCLHVCYAPEYESIEDTRQKLVERRKEVAWRLRLLESKKESGQLAGENASGNGGSQHSTRHGCFSRGRGQDGQSNNHSSTSYRQKLGDCTSDDQTINADGPVHGPMLPEEVERKRKHFHCSETGNPSYDSTVGAVRRAVTMFSTSLLPRQLKKLKKS